ncbi:MAG TPA: long-chain fatty acid--CoA ligase [Burkholderiaceae bacterium]|jgi:acyl-CoA synthetase (AMP-forming)/AMP-acid ligase II|nr:long-chain fatty acid--CoA ligase [Burkholderiaceae bacterium]
MYLTQGLHRAIQQRPNRPATIFPGRQHNFRELGERVAKLAGALKRLGLQPGDRVAMLSLNSDRYLEYYLAVFWAGGVVNPANTRWSAAELVYSFDDSESTILIVDDHFAPMAAGFRSQAKTIRQVIHAGDTATPDGMLSYEQILQAAAPVVDAYRGKDDLAGIFYTGGTTGFPKGVMLSHTNLWSSAMSLLVQETLTPDDIYLHAAPMFHLANGAMAMAQILKGGVHAFLPAFSPVALMQTIARDKVTHVVLVPVMIQMLVDHPALKEHDLSSLRSIAYGGAPISEAVLDRAFAALPGVEFSQGYGMTELSPMASSLTAYYHTPAGRKEGKLRSAGRALCTVEIKVVDADDIEVPRGLVGEVIVRGPNVMQGYWQKPKETAAAIRNGWMHTGDGAYMDKDGFIFIVDRLKDMIVSGGENIYCGEVESAIARHPAVATCAVVGIPDDKWGEVVHAVVVKKAGAEVSAEEIQRHCKELIAGYKCPHSVEFRDALPISGAGKVLKTALREPFWKGKTRAVN